MKIFVADGESGLMAGSGGELKKIGPPGEALCLQGGYLYCAGGSRCRCYHAQSEERLFDLSLPSGICGLSGMGNVICALSQDGDCLCAFCMATGEMRYSVPAGIYPRDCCKSPCGKYLAVAGGLSGEILLFDESLCCLKKYRVPGAACGVCFLPRGIAALCAVEEGELSSLLMKISPRGVTEEILSCPQAPCSLCALPDGQLLMGCSSQVIFLRPDGKISRRLSCIYPARIRRFRGTPLICDICRGEIFTGKEKILYHGKEPWDIALEE